MDTKSREREIETALRASPQGKPRESCRSREAIRLRHTHRSLRRAMRASPRRGDLYDWCPFCVLAMDNTVGKQTRTVEQQQQEPREGGRALGGESPPT
uniref:Uncharacterized protein n=1 Tax=Steinernema glaseri TaxID=37863 RepID=A0A1I7XZ77_9BILA